MNKTPQKPKILKVDTVARSRLFNIESVALRFSNGVERIYERMHPTTQESVMIVPIIGEEVLLIREYAVGMECYGLGFPKGRIDQGEQVLAAANRELMEEVGFGAQQFDILSRLTLAPDYFSSCMHIVLARDLYPKRLVGDEPESLTLVRWPRDNMMALLCEPDFNEARNVSALFLADAFMRSIR